MKKKLATHYSATSNISLITLITSCQLSCSHQSTLVHMANFLFNTNYPKKKIAFMFLNDHILGIGMVCNIIRL